MKFAVTFAALCLVVAPAGAQSTVSGTWTTPFPTRITRDQDGNEVIEESRIATITLHSAGDSVLGTWQLAPAAPNTTTTPLALHGRKYGDSIRVATDPTDRTVRVNGDERQVKTVNYYIFVAKGDSLHGESWIEATDGSFASPRRAFHAARG